MSLRDNIRIFVVDDMSASRGLLVMGLEKAGVKNVVHFDNAKKALKALETAPAHLILSDYNMPEMDGLEFLLALRKNPRTQKVGFILVSGTYDANVVNIGKRLGMNNYLNKPFTDEALQTCVQSVTGPL